MSIETWAIISTIALFSLANGGLFLLKFGAIDALVQVNKEGLERTDNRVNDLVSDVAELKGEVKVWKIS